MKWLIPMPFDSLTDLALTSIYMEDVLKSYRLDISAGVKVYPKAPTNWKTLVGHIPTMHGEDLFDNLSPSARLNTQIAFYSAVVTTEDDCPSDQMPSWEDMIKVNQFASATALRQQGSFQIDTPVFGIVLRSSRARVQVSWWSKVRDKPVSETDFVE